MKALTIYQPWASLVVIGAKPYEFRGWNPRERGGAYAAQIGQRIVIHASARKPQFHECRQILQALEEGGEYGAATCLYPDKAMPLLSGCAAELPLSVGLGTAILGEPRNGIEIAEEFGLPRVNDSDRDEHANWGWPMLDVEPWPEPVPMRGFQGFWNWPTPEGAGL